MNSVLAQQRFLLIPGSRKLQAPNDSTSTFSSEIIDFASSIKLITIIVSQKTKLLIQNHKISP